jgi:hypothetical protein
MTRDDQKNKVCELEYKKRCGSRYSEGQKAKNNITNGQISISGTESPSSAFGSDHALCGQDSFSKKTGRSALKEV